MTVDYLVVGGGAMGMAFTDTILTETDATVAIVDRRGRPGGHWNDAYPFVRLHQPSAFYGVNSRPLGSDLTDAVGWNKGLYELASGPEVCAYFDQVMNQRFLPSGRVAYHPATDHAGRGRVRSILSGTEWTIEANTMVDATYMNVSVPSTRTPDYEVASGVKLVPVNGLASMATVGMVPERYVIIGGGKTAMDACLWLLANEVDPAKISWIMPRDSWLLDRANIQPGAEFQAQVMARAAAQVEVAAAALSIDELFDGLEANGVLMRLDPTIRPTMYRCATVTRAELDQLRRIDNVVRLGRVRQIVEDEIVLDEGTLPTGPTVLHVDCTADGLARRPVAPIFGPGALTLQTVRTCQQVFSAAFIAHVEAAYDDIDEKNRLCTVVPHPDSEIDWLRSTLANMRNSMVWRGDKGLSAWLADARLDGFSRFRAGDGVDDPEVLALARKVFEANAPAIERLESLLAELV